jgi:hypothetical protein
MSIHVTASGSEADRLYQSIAPRVEKHIAITRTTYENMKSSTSHVGPLAKELVGVLENHLAALQRFRDAGDVEALRCCAKNIYSGSEGIRALHEAIAIMRQLGYRALSKRVTKRHVDAILSIHSALSSVTKPNVRPRFKGASKQESRLIKTVYRDFSQLPVVLSLIQDRQITDVDQIEAVMTEASRIPVPLSAGAL